VQRSADEIGTQVVMKRVKGPVGGNPRNGCEPGFNLGIANHTPFLCEANASTAFERCGDGLTVLRFVRLPNGAVRPARLIPPRRNGYYYFDPLLGGNGQQDVDVQCYNASSVDGSSPRTPLVAVGHAHTYPAYMPYADAWGSTIEVVSSEVTR
jgi:hypothetical protein